MSEIEEFKRKLQSDLEKSLQVFKDKEFYDVRSSIESSILKYLKNNFPLEVPSEPLVKQNRDGSVSINVREIARICYPYEDPSNRAKLFFEHQYGTEMVDNVEFAEDGHGFNIKLLQPAEFISITIKDGKVING